MDKEKMSVIALAGNPNVGKSTVFNALTGMKQHTGNWPGKTVETAQGIFAAKSNRYMLVDIPGTYSLMAHSREEEVARDFICFGESDATVVVCDATCLERNMNLVLQTLEITSKLVVCVNLMDEAKRKRISVNTDALSYMLGVPVVGISARNKKTVNKLTDTVEALFNGDATLNAYNVKYPPLLEEAVFNVGNILNNRDVKKLSVRWLALRLLEGDFELLSSIDGYLGYALSADAEILNAVRCEREKLKKEYGDTDICDIIVSSILSAAKDLCRKCVKFEIAEYNSFDRKLDKLLTGRLIGYPVMIFMLILILWITISGANYPSELLSEALFAFQDVLGAVFDFFGAPNWLYGIAVLGMYRVLAWVVSVMLPPMAIFFPLFTLLEDAGYLPRIAYNLDSPFQKCNACGKQALTMCMGLGCNSVGITGCRIIDSERERLLATLTNSFMPCNGKFPTLIALITMFFAFGTSGFFNSVISAVILTLLIVLAVTATFAVTKLLSKTLLKGEASSYTLELPSYRSVQVGKVIVRSVFDRTLFVLARAVTVAVPAGALIWLFANVYVGDLSLLSHAAQFLDGFGKFFGLDGVILISFILGMPANEIVVPIMIMAYTAVGTLSQSLGNLQLRELLIANGWTNITAVCTLIFMIFHWPCATSLLTLKRETKSVKWTLVAALLPTLLGLALCFFVKTGALLLGFC